MNRKKLNEIRARRARRVRAKITGTKDRPRLSLFRSNRYLYVQLIDDIAGRTLVSASTKDVVKEAQGKQQQIASLAELLTRKVEEAGIKEMVVDRGRYAYHGQVKNLIEILRKNGIKI
jgi:large subunit ribosomal protein L18